MLEPAARVDHEIRPRPLLGIRHLLGADRLERRLGHAGAGEHAGTLDLRRGRDDEDRVAAAVGPGLEQQRDVEDDQRRLRVAGEEGMGENLPASVRLSFLIRPEVAQPDEQKRSKRIKGAELRPGFAEPDVAACYDPR